MASLYGIDMSGWASLDRLRQEIQELLGSRESTGYTARADGLFPATNIYDAPDSLYLTAELPGVREKDLDVSVQGNQVVLRGQRSIEYPESASVHRRERQPGAFHRSLELPFAVDGDKVEASYRNGVLTLRLPKPSEHQRRQIQIAS